MHAACLNAQSTWVSLKSFASKRSFPFLHGSGLKCGERRLGVSAVCGHAALAQRAWADRGRWGCQWTLLLEEHER